ncbi:hypothetical protein J4447_02860 [Candidatus Pacearchaeota archaeon]|nr:hypothetical protein [Candidatus Pacearchaeota archaeon]
MKIINSIISGRRYGLIPIVAAEAEGVFFSLACQYNSLRISLPLGLNRISHDPDTEMYIGLGTVAILIGVAAYSIIHKATLTAASVTDNAHKVIRRSVSDISSKL